MGNKKSTEDSEHIHALKLALRILFEPEELGIIVCVLATHHKNKADPNAMALLSKLFMILPEDAKKATLDFFKSIKLNINHKENCEYH